MAIVVTGSSVTCLHAYGLDCCVLSKYVLLVLVRCKGFEFCLADVVEGVKLLIC